MKKIFWISIAAVTAAALLGVIGWRVAGALADRAQAEREVTPPVPRVLVQPVMIRDVAQYVTINGTIKPRNEVPVFTKVPGRVEDLLVDVGDEVEAGQVLAIIEHREIELQADQAMAGVQVAEAQVERARIGLDAARSAYDRLSALRQDDAIPQSEFEKIEFGLRDAKASMSAAESGLATAAAAAALAAQMVENARVTTPIEGTVTHRFVNLGSPAGQTMPLFQVQDLAVLRLESNAAAVDFARLRTGQSAAVTASDVPGAEFAGEVLTLSPSLNPMTRQAGVVVTIDNDDGRLLPNMFAMARIEVLREDGVAAIPRKALVKRPDGDVVFVVREGRAVIVKPELGSMDADYVVALSGLAEGDWVVVSGMNGLKDGDEVEVKIADTADAAGPEQVEGADGAGQDHPDAQVASDAPDDVVEPAAETAP